MFLSLTQIKFVVKVNRLITLLLISPFFVSFSLAQPCESLMPGATQRIYDDVFFLASDELAGREPGTEGAQMAIEYIQNSFQEAGVAPVYENSYLQEFPIPLDVEMSDDNLLIVADKKQTVPENYFPVKYSSNGAAEGRAFFVGFGIVAPELNHDDYEEQNIKGKIAVIDISSPDGVHPHSQYLKYHDLGERIKPAKEKGAIGVALVNREGTANDLSPNFKKIKSSGIPVVFIQDSELAKTIVSERGISMYINVSMEEQTTEGFNVVGYLDNGAPLTVAIGAHYDHLGMGNNSSSLYKGEPAIHNGADDNASGTAGLLELARNISDRRGDFSFANFLFLAFSGEEKGLLGSAYYVDHMIEEMPPISYMINMDMVGRMEEYELAVNGVGTSPIWPDLIEAANCESLNLKTSESGTGPSDHTSFYYKDIPVLHFFTGTHYDYHKPSDDAEKVNFEGEAQVLNLILNLVMQTEGMTELEFTATKTEQSETPRFSVTLGVLPDYMYDGEGMKIDGVNKDKPADKAGMKAGDIVTRMGEVKVTDMMSYMKALGQFKKGDKTTVEYQRDGKTQSATVTF